MLPFNTSLLVKDSMSLLQIYESLERAGSLVVGDLCSETKGSRFESSY